MPRIPSIPTESVYIAPLYIFVAAGSVTGLCNCSVRGNNNQASSRLRAEWVELVAIYHNHLSEPSTDTVSQSVIHSHWGRQNGINNSGRRRWDYDSIVHSGVPQVAAGGEAKTSRTHTHPHNQSFPEILSALQSIQPQVLLWELS